MRQGPARRRQRQRAGTLVMDSCLLRAPTSATSCSALLLLSTVRTCFRESKRGSEKQGATRLSSSSKTSQSTASCFTPLVDLWYRSDIAKSSQPAYKKT